jgi:ribosome-associated heat shock protein Hsp15
MSGQNSNTSITGAVRLDKWLWAARCFKTRRLSSDACAAGHVKLNGNSAKASKMVHVGDRLFVRTPGGDRELEIIALGDRRGPASVARTLYHDHTPAPPPKSELERPIAARGRGMGRPSKRERRLLEKFRGQ